jgi:predicted kinase
VSPRSVDRKLEQPRLILICGLPASGKTTLAKCLADAIPAVRLCPDEWMISLHIDLFDERSRDRFETALWTLTQQLLKLGISLILEFGFWTREERDNKRLTARSLGVSVELHYLNVPIDELTRRLSVRNKSELWSSNPITPDMLKQYAKSFQPPESAELSLYDPPEFN